MRNEWESGMSDEPSARDLRFGVPASGMLDSSDDVMAEMDRADGVHAEMEREKAETGMGSPDDSMDRRDRRCVSVLRRYMASSVKVGVELEDGSGSSFDCVEVLTCRNGVTLVQRADRASAPPPDGCACVLSINGRSVECRFTGVGFDSPGLGLRGHVFMFARSL